MKWIEVQIKTTTEAEEKVENILYDLGVGGLAIEDPNDVLMCAGSEEDWDYIDPSLLKHDFEGVVIKGYFPEGEDLIDKIEFIKQSVERTPQNGKNLGKVTVTEVYEKDWADAWKKYYKTKKVGKRTVIKPSWEEYEDKEQNDIIIELDPGMAFGTGTHETTIMCIRKLEEYVKRGYTIFDIGCGSGILSIASAKLGAGKVIGVDLDEVPVRVSKENVHRNGVEKIVDIRKGNLLDTIDEKADIIVSNIIAEIVADMAKDVKNYLKNDGVFIASGIIEEKVDYVVERLNKNGFDIVEIEKMGGWACIVSKMKKDV